MSVDVLYMQMHHWIWKEEGGKGTHELGGGGASAYRAAITTDALLLREWWLLFSQKTGIKKRILALEPVNSLGNPTRWSASHEGSGT